jgi:tRNA(Arg) A34 adenosine deaminase TadA
VNDDEIHLRRAIELSREAAAAGDRPYGAVLVKDGQRVCEARNRQTSARDVTAHAEMELVRDAQRVLGPEALQGATVYASGEPCAMCAGAMYWAGVRRVVFSVSQAEMARLAGGALLPITLREVLARASRPVEVSGPLLEAEGAQVLEEAAREARRR